MHQNMQLETQKLKKNMWRGDTPSTYPNPCVASVLLRLPPNPSPGFAPGMDRSVHVTS